MNWDPSGTIRLPWDRFGEMVPTPQPVRRMSVHDYMLTREIANIVIERAVESRAGFITAAAPAEVVSAVEEGRLLSTEEMAQLKEVETLEGPSVTILVEMNCVQGCLSMRHDPLKYDRYFWEFVEQMGSEIVSPCEKHTVRVMVEATPAVCDPSLPDSISQYPNQSRYGAFEVYMVAHMPRAQHVARCMPIFSKLMSRRWPNIPQLVEKCRSLVQPAFEQWDADEMMEKDMETWQARNELDLDRCLKLLDLYTGRVHTDLKEKLQARANVFMEADEAIRNVVAYGEIPQIRQALTEFSSKASPGVIAEAGMKLAHLEANEALKKNDDALRSAAADPQELREAIARFKERASGETLHEAENRLKTLDANMTLRQEVSPLSEADDIRRVIKKYENKASEDALTDATRRLHKVEGADAAIIKTLESDINSIHEAVRNHIACASPSVINMAEERVIHLEAVEAIETAQAEADAQLLSMPYEPDPERMLKMIEMHGELASWRAIQMAIERLHFLRQDITFHEEMAAATGEMKQELEPVVETTEFAAIIERYRETAYEDAIHEADVELSKMKDLDTALAATMHGGFESIPSLEAAINQLRKDASPSLVASADSRLQQLKAEERLSIASREPNASDIRALMEPSREHARPEAWAETMRRVDAIEAADAAINAATVRGPPESGWHRVSETASLRDIANLTAMLKEHSAIASPRIVAPAEVLLTHWVADDALHRVQLGVDITSTEMPSLLSAAIAVHHPPARDFLVAEIDVLNTLSGALIRELQADAAMRRLLRSKKMEEASAIKSVLEKHGEFAAIQLVNEAQVKLDVLDEADNALLAAVAEAMRIPTPPDSDEEDEMDQKGKKEDLPPERSIADKIFQAITEHGPLASPSVRQAVWRQGGYAVSMPPPPEKPQRKLSRQTDSPAKRKREKEQRNSSGRAAIQRALSRTGILLPSSAGSTSSNLTGFAALAAAAAAAAASGTAAADASAPLDDGAGAIPPAVAVPSASIPTSTEVPPDAQPPSLDARLGSKSWDESTRADSPADSTSPGRAKDAFAASAFAADEIERVPEHGNAPKEAAEDEEAGEEAAAEEAAEETEKAMVEEADEDAEYARMMREEPEEEAIAFSAEDAWEAADLWGAPAGAEEFDGTFEEDDEIAAMANEMISSAATVMSQSSRANWMPP